MTRYFIHRVVNSTYSVNKMSDDFEFIDSYQIIYNKHNKVCNCPAYRPYCKHLDYLKRWLEFSPKAQIQRHFNDKTNEWENPPEGLCLQAAADNIESFLNKLGS